MSDVSKIIRERNLVSLANNTKWTEFFELILPCGPCVLKFIDGDKEWETAWVISPALHYIEGAQFGPVHFNMIEWFSSEESALIKQAAKQSGLECDGSGKVWGYHS